MATAWEIILNPSPKQPNKRFQNPTGNRMLFFIIKNSKKSSEFYTHICKMLCYSYFGQP